MPVPRITVEGSEFAMEGLQCGAMNGGVEGEEWRMRREGSRGRWVRKDWKGRG